MTRRISFSISSASFTLAFSRRTFEASPHGARVLDADLGVDELVGHVLRLDVAMEHVADLSSVCSERSLEAVARDADR